VQSFAKILLLDRALEKAHLGIVLSMTPLYR
jgi:hypothetical protein